MGAYAGIGGAKTPPSHFLLQPQGEADGVVGSACHSLSPPVPVIPPLFGWKPPPVGDLEETAPQGIQGPIPPGQRPPQLILPAGLSLRLPPAPTATALGPEPALRKNSCEPGWLQKPGEPGLDSPVQAWALLPGPNSTGPQAGEEAEAWRRGRTSAGTRAELTGRQEVPPTRTPFLPAVEATLQPPRAARWSAEHTLQPFNKQVRDIFLRILMLLVNTTREHSGKSCFRSLQCHLSYSLIKKTEQR